MPHTVIYHPTSMPDLTAWNGTLISNDATRIVISDGVRTMEFIGAFTYDGDGNVFGTLNAFNALLNGVLQYRVSSLNVDANQVYTAVQASDVAGVAHLLLDGNDSIVGSAGADYIHGFLGSDTVRGNGGWDEVFGDGGNDLLYGGAGNDRLYGGNGNDRLQGDAGNDLLNGGFGIDTAVFAGTVATSVNLALTVAQNTGHGQDRLISIENVISGGGADVLRGNAAANTLTGNGGNDRLFGGGGSDRLFGGYGNDRLQGDAGNDLLSGGGGVDTAVFVGTATTHVDLALTTAQNTGYGLDRFVSIENVISGGGADLLRGNAVGNTLVANAGDDYLFGEGGNDALFGGAGYDWLDGGAGNDRVYGGNGGDILVGDLGDDLMDGGGGIDTLLYSGSTSVVVNLSLTAAQDTGYGNDTLRNIENVSSGSGHDNLTGNNGANQLSSGTGNDTVSGGGGNDTISGEQGDDLLAGGAGADTFYFSAGDGSDTISDFANGVDLISVDFGFVGSFADITVTDLGADAEIRFADVTITLLNFDHLLIGAEDFLF